MTQPHDPRQIVSAAEVRAEGYQKLLAGARRGDVAAMTAMLWVLDESAAGLSARAREEESHRKVFCFFLAVMNDDVPMMRCLHAHGVDPCAASFNAVKIATQTGRVAALKETLDMCDAALRGGAAEWLSQEYEAVKKDAYVSAALEQQHDVCQVLIARKRILTAAETPAPLPVAQVISKRRLRL